MIGDNYRRKWTADDYIDSLDRQDRRCFLTGDELTPETMMGVLETPTSEVTPETIRWVSKDAGKMFDGIELETALTLAEKTLRRHRPELFGDDPKDANSNVAVG